MTVSSIGHPATLSVGGPGGPVLSTGVDVFHRLEVWYGSNEDPLQALDLDLDGTNSLRTTFATNDAVVNFNVVIYDLENRWASNGTNPAGAADIDLAIDDFVDAVASRKSTSATSAPSG